MTTLAIAPLSVQVGGGQSPSGKKVLLNVDGNVWWLEPNQAEDIGAALVRCAKRVRAESGGAS